MNTQQLEAQSDRDRQDIQNTIGEIKQRLSPGQLVDELLAYTKDGGASFLSNLGRQASENPMPVTLIGAGIAWFLMSRDGKGAAHSSVGAGRASELAQSASEFGDDVAQKAGAAASSIGEKARNAAGEISDAASSAAASASDKVSAIADSAKDTFKSAQSLAAKSAQFAIDQPLVLLGVGIAAGAAIGAALPGTEIENQVMGDSSSELKQTVCDAASDQLETAKEAGKDFFQDVTQAGDSTGQRQ